MNKFITTIIESKFTSGHWSVKSAAVSVFLRFPMSAICCAGVPLRTVQLYVGHAHITTTEGHASGQGKRRPRF
ncbi:MAG: hypothetical protein HY525_18545 [Betaproteobacteria bacterium]|nr:hypothetical protein [Betaproteobacteria bacterium]